MSRPVETATAWSCPRCHDLWRSSMAMPAPFHLCDRSGKVENFTVSWTPEIAVQRELPVVRRLQVAA